MLEEGTAPSKAGLVETILVREISGPIPRLFKASYTRQGKFGLFFYGKDVGKFCILKRGRGITTSQPKFWRGGAAKWRPTKEYFVWH
jgi:hypothetical protein